MTDGEIVREYQRTGDRKLIEQLSDRYVPDFITMLSLLMGREGALEEEALGIATKAWQRAIDEFAGGEFHVFAFKTMMREYLKSKSVFGFPDWLKLTWRNKIRPFVKKSRAEPTEFELDRLPERCAMLLLWIDIEKKSFREAVQMLIDFPELNEAVKLSPLPKNDSVPDCWERAEKNLRSKTEHCRRCLGKLRS